MPEPAIVNKSPRARFQESSDNISKHRDLIASREFQRAADFALLEYMLNVSKSESSIAGASHWRILGAEEFLYTLRNLGESATLSTVKPIQNLEHKV